MFLTVQLRGESSPVKGLSGENMESSTVRTVLSAKDAEQSGAKVVPARAMKEAMAEVQEVSASLPVKKDLSIVRMMGVSNRRVHPEVNGGESVQLANDVAEDRAGEIAEGEGANRGKEAADSGLENSVEQNSAASADVQEQFAKDGQEEPKQVQNCAEVAEKVGGENDGEDEEREGEREDEESNDVEGGVKAGGGRGGGGGGGGESQQNHGQDEADDGHDKEQQNLHHQEEQKLPPETKEVALDLVNVNESLRMAELIEGRGESEFV